MRIVVPSRSGASSNVRKWQLSLGLGFAVTAIAGGLLLAVVRTAQGIHLAAGDVWTAGKLIAGNTVHVPHLHHINVVADQIGQSLEEVERAAARIRRAVESNSPKEG